MAVTNDIGRLFQQGIQGQGDNSLTDYGFLSLNSHRTQFPEPIRNNRGPSPVFCRSPEGAAAFATVRSYLSTLRKQSIDFYPALVMTFRGQPPMPRLA